MKVRALPTCRKPVGEGAKRTRWPVDVKSSFLREIEDSDMGTFMVRGGEKQRQAPAPCYLLEDDSAFHTPCTEIVLSLRAGL
jgi:hypothetical protein